MVGGGIRCAKRYITKSRPPTNAGSSFVSTKKKTLFELRQYAIHIGVVSDIHIPSKIEWDLTNGPLGKLLKLLDAQV